MPEAEADIRKATEIDPRNDGAHCKLGQILRLQGRLAEAEAAFRAALGINPRCVGACTALGDMLRSQPADRGG